MTSNHIVTTEFIRQRVVRFYWKDDINCARTVLNILSEHFTIVISDQLHHAAVGMHGAGGYGAQCGLVEGTLLFIGIFGNEYGFTEKEINQACRSYAEQFEKNFKSLQCRVLRAEEKKVHKPPHICEPLTRKAILNAIQFIEDLNKNEV